MPKYVHKQCWRQRGPRWEAPPCLNIALAATKTCASKKSRLARGLLGEEGGREGWQAQTARRAHQEQAQGAGGGGFGYPGPSDERNTYTK